MSAFNHEAFRLAIRSRREAMGLSLRQLADQSGISFATIARFERGEGDAVFANVTELVAFLGLRMDAFWLPADEAAP